MPDTALSVAIKEAYAAAPADETIIHTLEFHHPVFSEPIRVVLDHVDHTCTLEADAPENALEAVLFVGYSFDMVPPAVDDGAAPEVVITIDNVSVEIEDNINAALATTDKVTVIYRAYLRSDPSAPQNNPTTRLTVTQVSADQFQLTARAQLGDFANKAFPGELYTATRFPGLVR
jgi:hypothetical protein